MNTQKIQQWVFDTVVRHAREQGEKAEYENGGCAYRTRFGLKCFMGALIDDNQYDPGLEGQGVESAEVESALIKSTSPIDIAFIWRHPDSFLRLLQTIHDDHIVEEWEHEFEEFAGAHNLTVPQA